MGSTKKHTWLRLAAPHRWFIYAAFFAFTSCGALVVSPAPAQAACITPSALAGAVEWFVADTKFKYCDGTVWIAFGMGSGYWTAAGNNVYYNDGNVGVAVADPKTTVEVAGHVRVSDNNLSCNTTNDGALRYNSSTNIINYCDGAAWRNLAASTAPACPTVEVTTAGTTTYTVLAGCTSLSLEAYGAGGGAGFGSNSGGGGGGSTRVDDSTPTTLVLGGGGGGANQPYYGSHGGGGGGGYGQKTVTLAVGAVLTIIVGDGGKNGCASVGGDGGAPSGGAGGNSAAGAVGTYGGGGGGDYNYRGGNSTFGGAGGASNTSNVTVSTTYGGAGGSGILSSGCGATTYGGTCGGLGEGGGGGSGIGDVVLQGDAGGTGVGGPAASGGPGAGADYGTSCTTGKGGTGKVVIRPL